MSQINSIETAGGNDVDVNNLVVTASSPLIFTDENGKSAVAAVVGLQMKYEKFYELFMNTTKPRVCPPNSQNEVTPNSCNYTCDSQVGDLIHDIIINAGIYHA